MTNIGAPFQLQPGPSTPPRQPTLEYFLRGLSLMGYTPSSRRKLILAFAKYKAKLWVKMWTAAMDSMGLEMAAPAERLLYYLRMSIVHPEYWTEWQLKIPTGKYGYENHWNDYQELRQRGIRGDFGPVLALACITGRLPPALLATAPPMLQPPPTVEPQPADVTPPELQAPA